MKHNSNVVAVGAVPFPVWTGERVYMKEFTKAEGLPPSLQRWQPTVDAMLTGLDAPGQIYLMIDQGVVAPNATHRRGGIHIDGYWCAQAGGHGGRHGSTTGSREANKGYWEQCDFATPEAIVLASDVQAARAYKGQWTGAPGQGGDCSHVDVQNMEEVALLAGVAYVGNVAMLHESLPTKHFTRRTVVRLNIPGCTAAH